MKRSSRSAVSPPAGRYRRPPLAHLGLEDLFVGGDLLLIVDGLQLNLVDRGLLLIVDRLVDELVGGAALGLGIAGRHTENAVTRAAAGKALPVGRERW